MVLSTLFAGLALAGGVVASPAPFSNDTIVLSSNMADSADAAAGSHVSYVRFFDNDQCYPHSSAKWRNANIKIPFYHDLPARPEWHSVWIPQGQKYENAAAFAEFSWDPQGEAVCCGDFLGSVAHGCHRLNEAFSSRIRCLMPLDPSDWDTDRRPPQPSYHCPRPKSADEPKVAHGYGGPEKEHFHPPSVCPPGCRPDKPQFRRTPKPSCPKEGCKSRHHHYERPFSPRVGTYEPKEEKPDSDKIVIGGKVYWIEHGDSKEYPEKGYPKKPYHGKPYHEGSYLRKPYPEKDYPETEYPEKGYPKKSYHGKPYHEESYLRKPYPEKDYPEKEYPEKEYPEKEYPWKGYPGKVHLGEWSPDKGRPDRGYPEKEYPEKPSSDRFRVGDKDYFIEREDGPGY